MVKCWRIIIFHLQLFLIVNNSCVNALDDHGTSTNVERWWNHLRIPQELSTQFNMNDELQLSRHQRAASKKKSKSSGTQSSILNERIDEDHLNDRFVETRTLPISNTMPLSILDGNELNLAIKNAKEKIQKRVRSIEPNIFRNNVMQNPGTFGWLIGTAMKSSSLAKNFSHMALIAEETSKMLTRKHRLNVEQVNFALPELEMDNTILGRDCPKPMEPIACYPGRYRSLTGHCNNVEHADWGSANTPFGRWLIPRYFDRIAEPRRASNGKLLPSARDISLIVHHDDQMGNVSHMTTLTTFFGEFIFHDIAQTVQSTGFDGQRIRCCNVPQSDLMHPDCFPIRVNQKDRLMRQDCLEYVRSLPTIRSRCRLGPREQINQVSSFIDGSSLYGSSRTNSDSLRSFIGGQLKSSQLIRDGKEMLSLSEAGFNDFDCRSKSGQRCFRSGDGRVNENLGLTIIHTLFMREHNRIARELSTINPDWSDDQLYEETRKIVGAQLQHITYNELLPYILGEELMDRFDLRVNNEGFYNDYDLKTDATVDNSVANAVFDFLMTTIPSHMERFTRDLNMMGSVRMIDSFFNPKELFESNRFDQYLLGMISQTGMMSDRLVVNDMVNSVVGDNQREMFDFVAFVIQKGRDHGLPGYLEHRKACQLDSTLNTIHTFDDLKHVMDDDVRTRLSNIYKNVRDIDLFTGGLSERPLEGALVGPTFGCLLARQFRLLRRGDRFWYENNIPPSSFRIDQLAEIRKTTLSRIVCDNGNHIDFVQPQTMVTSDPYLNAFQFCSSMKIFPRIDLTKWKHDRTNHRQGINLDSIKPEMLNRAMIRARRETNDLFQMEHQQTQSNPLSKSQIMHYSFTRAKRQTISIGNRSIVLEKATNGILHQLQRGRDRESQDEIFNDITNLVRSLPQIELEEYMRRNILAQNQFNDEFLEKCDDNQLPCDHTSPFRTITGWCNNLNNPDFGKSLTIFERFLPPMYEDGVSIPRTKSFSNGRELPSPRLISFTVHDNFSTPHVRYSLATMQWGQLLDHDITLTPSYLTSNGKMLNCKACNSKQTVHPECNPISIPNNDPFFRNANKQEQCLHFVRSMNAQKTLGAREQMNQITAYVDGSSIYGSENCEADRLRTHIGGMLNVTKHPINGLKTLLPQTTEHPECKAPSGFCFLAGDNRASEQPALACLHTIFLREHNRIAERLAKLNSHWSDERLYQTTRKIISAFFQQITFREFLPRLIGNDLMNRFDLVLLNNGYYQEYDPTCSASIRNEISAAVLRLGHTLLKPSFSRLNSEYKRARKPLFLRESFFNSDMLYESNGMDEILRGIITSSVETFDSSITSEVTNHLFEEPKKSFSGMDLIALNLQRSRDHGLQPYNHYRELCNLTRARRFEDLAGEIPQKAIQNLRRVYQHVDDIELFSGGISETPLHGALVGPTFGCLLAIQFQSLRKCDRFWYETDNKFTRFSKQQLAEIRKISLSKIVCTNSDNIKLIQKQAMDVHDIHLNPRIPCKSLPTLDLRPWSDVDKSCLFTQKSKQVIPLGKHKRVSPCVNCVCSLEGMICTSIRIQDCRQLMKHFSRNEIHTDQSCMVQCAFMLSKRPNRRLPSL